VLGALGDCKDNEGETKTQSQHPHSHEQQGVEG
jgi:hypothetical protein